MAEEITAEELHRRLSAGGVQVIDVRPEEEFRRGHVPGAINVPLEEFARRIAEVDVGDDVVVVCPVGESSRQAARLLESYAGVADDARVSNLAGGYAAWPYELETSG